MSGLAFTITSASRAQEPRAEAAPAVADGTAIGGRVGLSWLGFRSMPFPGVSTGGTPSLSSIDMPVIGLRMWRNSSFGFAERYALELGLGFAVGSRSTTTAGTSIAGPSHFGIIGQASLPLAVRTTRHVTFEIVPAARLGFATGGTGGAGTSGSGLNGLMVELGAGAGAEVHFGFMGIPDLSLEGLVGFGFAFHTVAVKPDAPSSQTTRITDFGMRLFTGSAPWDIFRATVAARYYF